MRHQYAFIGLGNLAIAMLEKLHKITNDIILVDRDDSVIERFKNWVKKAHIVNLTNSEILEQILGETIDTVIVDLGNSIETAIITVSTLKKLQIPRILVCCETAEQEKIFKIVGATEIIVPAKETAEKLVPLLVSNELLSFFPISSTLVIAELRVPEKIIGKSLIQVNFRKNYNLNVIATRKENSKEYVFFAPDYCLESDDVLLCAGATEHIEKLAGVVFSEEKPGLTDFFSNIFKKK